MNKSITLFAALLLTLCYSCKKSAKELADVNEDIPYAEEIEFPAIPLPPGLIPPGGVSIPALDTFILTNYKSYLTQYNTSESKVIHVKLKSLAMEITTPTTQTADFIDTVRVYVFGNNLPAKLVAYKYPVPKGLHTLETTVVDDNIKDYFLHDTLYVRLSGHINDLPAGGTKIKLSTVFNLLANPLN